MVTGYHGGEYRPGTGRIEVSTRDAHAWTEVWEQAERKWLRVDPTGAIAPERIELGGQRYFSPLETGWFCKPATALVEKRYLAGPDLRGWNIRNLLPKVSQNCLRSLRALLEDLWHAFGSGRFLGLGRHNSSSALVRARTDDAPRTAPRATLDSAREEPGEALRTGRHPE